MAVLKKAKKLKHKHRNMKTRLQGSRKETKRKPIAAYAKKWTLPIRRLLPVSTKACVIVVFSDRNGKFRDSSLSLDQALLTLRNLLASMKTCVGIKVSPTDGHWGASSKPTTRKKLLEYPPDLH